jgi:5'-3' exonuclease
MDNYSEYNKENLKVIHNPLEKIEYSINNNILENTYNNSCQNKISLFIDKSIESIDSDISIELTEADIKHINSIDFDNLSIISTSSDESSMSLYNYQDNSENEYYVTQKEDNKKKERDLVIYIILFFILLFGFLLFILLLSLFL